MNIFIDGYGLAKYLEELFSKIRRDRDVDNTSIFNINNDVWTINQVFVKQTLYATFWNKQKDPDIPKKDIDFVENRRNDSCSNENVIKTALEPYIPIDEVERSAFIEDLDNWIKLYEGTFKPLPIENTKTSSAISIMQNKEDDLIDLERIMYSLKKVFFVEGTSLNTIRFTPELKRWGVVSHALENETEIVIVDRYFFQPNGRGISNIKESYDFIEALCSKGKEKSILIFFENDDKNMRRKQMDEFTDRIRIKANCQITFVGIYPSIKKGDQNDWFVSKVLHDRFIISNYRIICSGHSFVQYFKNDIFSAHGSMFLTIGAIADKRNEKVMSKALQYLQVEILSHEAKPYFIYNKDHEKNIKVLSLALKW